MKATVCCVCEHPQRAEIDEHLSAGMSQRSVSVKYNVNEKAVLKHCRTHVRIPHKGETNSFRELRELKDRIEKSLNRIESGSADDIERKQQSALMREHRTITEKLGSLSGEINSKTVGAMLHRLGVKSERELMDIVEERRKMSDITVEDLASDCVKGLKDVFSMNPALRDSVRAELFPEPEEPEMEG